MQPHKSKSPLPGLALAAVLLGAMLLWEDPAVPEVPVVASLAPAAANAPAPASPWVPQRGVVETSTQQPRAPVRAATPTVAPGFMAKTTILPQVLAARGLDALNPWQGRRAAVEATCNAPDHLESSQLDAWMEMAVWDRGTRGVWAAARRASGATRVDFLSNLAANTGVVCPLVDRLQRDFLAGTEAGPLVPTHGSAAGMQRMDARLMTDLERDAYGH